MTDTNRDAEALAQRFHEAYERLAPSFGYETREASAKPWVDVPEKNKRLMIAVCAEVFGPALLVCGQMAPAESYWPCSRPPSHSDAHENAAKGWARSSLDSCAPSAVEGRRG